MSAPSMLSDLGVTRVVNQTTVVIHNPEKPAPSRKSIDDMVNDLASDSLLSYDEETESDAKGLQGRVSTQCVGKKGMCCVCIGIVGLVLVLGFLRVLE